MSIEEINIPENNFNSSIPNQNQNQNRNLNKNKNKNKNVKNFNYNPYSNINNQEYKKPSQINYDEILKNMGMYQSGGKLYWDQEEPDVQSQKTQPENKNSYIYNKYFKNELKDNVQVIQPKNMNEYRNMLIQRIIDRRRAELIKSRNMVFK